jgi:hypothetical protein
MRHWNRALTTLAAAAAAGLLLWFAPHFHRWTTSGYWEVIVLMAVAGMLIGISQLHGSDGNPTASFLVVFVPVLVAAGWVILAAQPQGDWVRNDVLSWSGDIGIGHAVHNLGEHVAVLAFALGAVFGLTFEPKMVRRRPKTSVASIATVVPSPPPLAADPVEEPSAEEQPAQPEEQPAQPEEQSAQQAEEPPAQREEPPAQQPESGEQGPATPPD